MTDRTYETQWHGQAAWVIESDTVRLTTVPGMGAKIASLIDKRQDFEWLVDPGRRPVQPVPYGALWHEQDMSGWDEMFPTIVACDYPGPGPLHGQPLPDHGEAWTLPWEVIGSAGAQLTLCLRGKALPYTLERTAECADPGLVRLHYRLTNLGDEPMPYVWASHPQFLCGDDADVSFPPEVTEVINTIPESWGWGQPETCFRWPVGTGVDGSLVRLDHAGPAALHQGRKLFAQPHVRAGWAGLQRRTDGHWLRFEWDPVELPYLGLWVDEGALNHATVATLEPTTGFYDSLRLAWDKGLVETVLPGATRTWTLTVRLGTAPDSTRTLR